MPFLSKQQNKCKNNHKKLSTCSKPVFLFSYAEKQEAPTRCAEASMQYGMLWGPLHYLMTIVSLQISEVLMIDLVL